MPGVNRAELPLAQQGLPARLVLLGVAALAGCFFVGLMTILLPRNGPAATMLLDYADLSPFPYPFTVQNLMHVLFFVGLGELFVRSRTAQWEMRFLSRGFLPEDDQTVLQAHDLGPIRRQVAKLFDGDNGFLPSLIDISILQFQAGRSVDQTVSVLNSSLELIAHRLDLRYQLIRYLAWLIPTLGFIGTVVGIAGAMAYVKSQGVDLDQIGANLAIAFNTTIVALIQAAVLVLGIHEVQKREEQSLNLAGNYCLRNLVNRLYAG
ncbi:MAG: MotA/TolQ/ExbB proton channel family protein [Acidimicrobiia bacterium]|nr:MotA/TolQ/ExbB proton channel family protein [Acidimicrobiia bacterium]